MYGSSFSSFDTTIELLHKDEEARRAAAQILLGQVAAEATLPSTPGEGVIAVMELFEESYQDYLGCRGQVRRCADEFARGGEIDDFDDAMEPILRRCAEILDNRKAKLAVCMAAAYNGRVGSLDPANRYHFEDHAPAIMELTGPAAETHRIVMDVMFRRLREFGALAPTEGDSPA